MRHTLTAPAVFIATVMAGSLATLQQSATSARLLEQLKTTAVFRQQFEIAKELAKVGDAQALAALEPLLRDDDRHVRANAAFVFASRGDARGLETLTAIVADRSNTACSRRRRLQASGAAAAEAGRHCGFAVVAR